MSPDAPTRLLLEISRDREVDDPWAFQTGLQGYRVRRADGSYWPTRLDWDRALLEDLAAAHGPRASREVEARLSHRLGAFLAGSPLSELEPRLVAAAQGGAAVLLDLRLAAAELFGLPWDLLPLRASGLQLGGVAGALIRLSWAGAAPPPPPPAISGRVLLAASSAGGGVPLGAHREGLEHAARVEPVFDASRDLVRDATPRALARALEQAAAEGRPYSALHLLSHGAADPTGGALVLHDERGAAHVVPGERLAELLAPHATSLRLVLLMACSAGHDGAPGRGLGGVALRLHRAGLASVVTARAPLSVPGSIAFAGDLWERLLRRSTSLEAALRDARAELGRQGAAADRAAIALFGHPDEGADSRPVPLRPYRGLLTFEVEDRAQFYGRGQVTEALLARVRAAATAPLHLVILVGASGSGKSSLARAGLLAAIRDRSGWQDCALRPELDLAAQVQDHQAIQATGAGTLWLVDPLDALFNSIDDPALRARAAEALLTLAQRPGELVLATLRPDLLSRCAEVTLSNGRRLDAILYASGALVFLAAPEREQLREAIVEPARRVGLEFEPGLVDVLLDDAGTQPGALPLLQHTLDQLWAGRAGRTLTHAVYNAMGGLGGALAQTADALMAELGDAQRDAWAILEAVVVVDAEGLPHRRAADLAELRPRAPEAAAPFDAALRRLTDARLVVVSKAGERDLVELAHESLLRRWEPLRARAVASRELRGQTEELRLAAERWERQGRTSDFLLVGQELGFYGEVAARAWGDRCPTHVAAFLEASREAATAARRADEAERAQKLWMAERARDAALLATARAMRAEDPTQTILLLREVSDREQESGWVEESLSALRGSVCVSTCDVTATPRDLVTALCPTDPTHWVVPAGPEAQIRAVQGEALTGTLPSPSGAVVDVAWSPTGRHLSMVTASGRAWLWQASGVLDRELSGVRGAITHALFSPDGASVLLASREGELALVPLDGGPPERLGSQIGGLRLARWSTGGGWLATVAEGEPRVVRLRRPGQPGDLSLRGAEGGIRAIAFDSFTQRLAAVGDDGVARVWSPPSPEPTLIRIGVPLTAVAWSIGGETLLIGGHSGALHLRTLGAPWRSVRGDAAAVVGVQPMTADTTLVLHANGRLREWRLALAGTSEPVPLALGRHNLGATLVSWSPSGDAVLSGARDCGVRLCSADGLRRRPLAGHRSEISALAWAPDGRRVAAGADEGALRVWECATGRALVEQKVLPNQVDALAWSPDGTQIAAGSQVGALRVVDAADGQTRQELTGHRNAIQLLRWSPDGRTLWSFATDGTARRWDEGRQTAIAGEEMPRWLAGASAIPELQADRRAPPGFLRVAALAPAEGLLVGAASGALVLLDPMLRPVVEVGRVETELRAVAISPDGRWVAAGDRGGELRMWRVGAAQPSLVERLSGASIVGLQFDPRASRVAIHQGDGTVHIIADDGIARPLKLPLAERAKHLAFDPTGQWLAICDEAGAVALWPVGTRALREQLQAATRCALSPSQRERLLGEHRRWDQR